MEHYRRLKFKLYCWRQAWRKRNRLWFPSPAEVELVRIMGGRYITISWIKDHKTGFPLTIITDLGTIFKRELIQREVRAGARYVDFGQVTPYGNRGIEVDGRLYHDVVRDMERDEYLAEYGWTVIHINAGDIYRNPQQVQQRVISFLSR